jgi:hypothetical protein
MRGGLGLQLALERLRAGADGLPHPVLELPSRELGDHLADGREPLEVDLGAAADHSQQPANRRPSASRNL